MVSSRVGTDACSLSRRWTLSPTLARMLVALETEATRLFSAQGFRWPGIFVISGYRSPRLQARLNPLAPQSRHTFCPSMAADLRVGNLPASTTPTEFWAFLGTIWKKMGGRWGGDFTVPEPDPNHFEALAEIPITEMGVMPIPTRPIAPTPRIPKRRSPKAQRGGGVG